MMSSGLFVMQQLTNTAYFGATKQLQQEGQEPTFPHSHAFPDATHATT